MIARWKQSALIIFLALLFVPAPAAAQTDPQAENHAWAMYRAMESSDVITFTTLFNQDPTLTKKAFVYVVLYAGQQNEQVNVQNALDFANLLAQAIDEHFGDPMPTQIIESIFSGDSSADQLFVNYAASLYPEISSPAAQTTVSPPPAQPSTGGSPGQTGAFDPAAENHAGAMYQALQAGDKNTFQSLFRNNPLLTKKAYVYVVTYMAQSVQTNQEQEARSAAEFAVALAQAIQSEFGDPVPLQIMQKLAQEDPAGAQMAADYAESLYSGGGPAVAQTASGEDRETQEWLEQIIAPTFVKLARAVLAVSFSDPELIMQELDTFEPVLEQFKQDIIKKVGEWPPEAQAEFDTIHEALELLRLDVMAELGLLQEFDSRALQLVEKQEDVGIRLGVLTTGFRMAFRQEQYDKAQSYLDRARRELSQTGSPSPVYRFIVKTADQQLKLARGHSSTPSQTLSAFNDAWSELSNYRPTAVPDDDIAWAYGRHFARFWVEELAAIESDEGMLALAQILEPTSAWMDALSATGELQGEDALSQLQGQLTLAFSALDIVLHVFEQKPVLLGALKAQDLDALPAMLDSLGDFTQELNPGGPGFPPFSLADSSQVKEIRVRVNYLKGLDPSKPVAQRVAALEAVLPQLQNLDRPNLYIGYHIELGHVLKELNRGDLALVAWERAFQKAEELSFVSRSVEAASLLASEFGARNQWEKASLYAGKAQDGLQEELGTSAGTSGLTMAKKTSNLSSLAAKAAIKSNKPQEALALLSEGQQMNTAAIQLSGNKEAAEATKELQTKKKQVATLTQKVQELQQMPESSTRNEMIKKAETLLAETKSEFLLQSRNIRQKFSKLYTTALRFDPLNLPDVQKALPPDTAVVQYFATDEELYIFVVTRDQFRLRSVAQSKDSLDGMVLSFLKQIKRLSGDQQQLATVSSNLYQVLVAPIEQDLANSSTVVLIPSGKLNILPFGALTDASGKAFLEKKTLLELAKPTDFMKIAGSEAQPVTSVVTFANATKDLPAAEREGERITELFPNSKLFMRDEASKANLMEFGNKAEVLHLATHGTWDSNNALNNHLKLSNNETLAQEEIFNLDLEGTSIVTLSACNTALADSQEVEYVASLAEAFWIAGSRSVVASLWPVDDESTGLLMTKFYERLKAGDGKAKALQQAQLAVRQDPKFSHPYFWSGFILFGDYR